MEVCRITIISNLPFLTHILLQVLYKRKRVTCYRNIKWRIELDNHRILNSTWVKKYNLCFSYKQMVIRVRNRYTGITPHGKSCRINCFQLLHFAYYTNNGHLMLTHGGLCQRDASGPQSQFFIFRNSLMSTFT